MHKIQYSEQNPITRFIRDLAVKKPTKFSVQEKEKAKAEEHWLKEQVTQWLTEQHQQSRLYLYISFYILYSVVLSRVLQEAAILFGYQLAGQSQHGGDIQRHQKQIRITASNPLTCEACGQAMTEASNQTGTCSSTGEYKQQAGTPYNTIVCHP